MKQKIIIFLMAILMLPTNIFAETKNYNIENPKEVQTSLTIVEEASIDDNRVEVTMTIPETYNQETINLNPSFFREIAKDLNNNVAYIMPGDRYTLTLNIINNSKYIYEISDNYIEIFPSNQENYDVLSRDVTLFNGLYPTTLNKYMRLINKAYINLGITDQSMLTNEFIDKLLKENNYSGIDELGTYMLDYYNKLYNKSYNSLIDFDTNIIDEILGGNRSSKKVNLESNKDMIKLHYDYFYNNLIGYTLENNIINDSNTNIYSIGEHLRNKNLDKDIIEKTIKKIYPNTKNAIKINMLINGKNTKNAYAYYEYDISTNLKYNAQKGKLIVNYIDETGNKLIDSFTKEDMVFNPYQAERKDINNYKLVNIEGKESDYYKESNSVVNYVYKKINNTQETFLEVPNTGIN